MDGVVTERRHRTGVPWGRFMASWAAGTHWPDPVNSDDGWRCRTCWYRLREYTGRQGERRLRHYRP